MQQFFNYSTLEVVLLKATRTLAIYLNRPQHKNAINLEMLFELESILAWCTGRVEIKSILIASRTESFSQGIEQDRLAEMDGKALERITSKLQLITQALVQLPQTIVVDVGDDCHNLASELAIGADLRIGSKNIKLSFNHTHMGLVPCSGGIGILSSIVGSGHARGWILTGTAIRPSSLQSSGFINEFYDSTNRGEVTHAMLTAISNQASVARIQTKFGLYQFVGKTCEDSMKFEAQVGRAALLTSDWKRKGQSFQNAREFKTQGQFKIVKNEEEAT